MRPHVPAWPTSAARLTQTVARWRPSRLSVASSAGDHAALPSTEPLGSTTVGTLLRSLAPVGGAYVGTIQSAGEPASELNDTLA